MKAAPSEVTLAYLQESLRDDVKAFFWHYDGVPEQSDERSVQLLVEFRKAFGDEDDERGPEVVTALQDEVEGLEADVGRLEDEVDDLESRARERQAQIDDAYEGVRRLRLKIEQAPMPPDELLAALEAISVDLTR